MCTRKSLKTNTIARACKASAYFALGQTVVLNQNKIHYKCFFQRFSTAKKLKARQAGVTFFALNICFLKLNSFSPALCYRKTVLPSANQNEGIFRVYYYHFKTLYQKRVFVAKHLNVAPSNFARQKRKKHLLRVLNFILTPPFDGKRIEMRLN